MRTVLTLRFLGTEILVSNCSVGNSWVTFRKAMASSGRAHQRPFASLTGRTQAAASGICVCVAGNDDIGILVESRDPSVLVSILFNYFFLFALDARRPTTTCTYSVLLIHMPSAHNFSGDDVASCVLDTFHRLPAKRKPLQRPNGSREWVPLSGVVLAQGSNLLL